MADIDKMSNTELGELAKTCDNHIVTLKELMKSKAPLMELEEKLYLQRIENMKTARDLCYQQLAKNKNLS